MNTYEEKISLLLEMIAFSVVDGKLHRREYDFLFLIANGLGIDKAVFDELFHAETPTRPIRSEFERIQQFYRLALLMHVDGLIHQKEEQAIYQMSINMGLDPAATKKMLKLMKESPSAIIDPQRLIQTFQQQQN